MGEWTPFRLAKVPAVLALVLLVASNLVTDRWYFMQAIWWIPRIALVVPALLWLAALLAIARWLRRDQEETRRLGWWTVAAALLALVQVLRMWGLPAARPSEALRIVHWNPSYPSGDAIRGAVEKLAALDADIYLFTDAGPDVLRESSQLLVPKGYMIEGAGKFSVVSRLTVTEAMPVLAARNRFVSRFTLATGSGPLIVETIDLPSAPTLPRTLTMRSLRGELAQLRATEPDIMVGDFNITRGSHSLSLIASDYSEAFETNGTGWGATYPRDWPFIGIDLTFLRAPWYPLRSEIVDPGAGRHRAQVVDCVKQ
ncbi:MAG: hypothetical protein QM516_06770 [Limnohabitans sp.]|jgi:hypothetical protein|nr:hypothetical protein [Limnohabitans sp.]